MAPDGEKKKVFGLWIAGTGTATLVGMAALFSYVHGFVYTRAEGIKLEQRVELMYPRVEANKLEHRFDKLSDDIKGDLKEIRQTVREIRDAQLQAHPR